MGEWGSDTPVFSEVQYAAACPLGRVGSAPHDEVEPGLSTSGRAHGAWLEGDEERAAPQPPASDGLTRGPQGQDLGMSGGVPELLLAVVLASDDEAIVNHHGTHRNLSVLGRDSCLCEGESHVLAVALVEDPVGKHGVQDSSWRRGVACWISLPSVRPTYGLSEVHMQDAGL